jgi:hypothetical protein
MLFIEKLIWENRAVCGPGFRPQFTSNGAYANLREIGKFAVALTNWLAIE